MTTVAIDVSQSLGLCLSKGTKVWTFIVTSDNGVINQQFFKHYNDNFVTDVVVLLEYKLPYRAVASTVDATGKHQVVLYS